MASLTPIGDARPLLDRFRFSPLARLHTTIRWLSAPLPEVEQQLPRAGRILEIGCGHGLFSGYAALRSPERSVLGTDIDSPKIATARRALQDAENVSFAAADGRSLPAGPWDAIVIIDVLYLLDSEAQAELVRIAAGALAPDGLLLVKTMAEQPAWKARWNVLQETVSLRLLGITKGATMTFAPLETQVGWLASAGLDVEVVPLDRHRLHPHQLLIGRR